MRRHLLIFFAVASMATAVLPIHATTQATTANPEFAKRVVTTGLENPFQMIWGPDDFLWVTERTAGRVTRVRPSDGSKATAITIGDGLQVGPGGLLGMTFDPGLLKGTGNDHVYVAYTYDADTDAAKVSSRTKIVRYTYDPKTHTLGSAIDVLAGLPAGTD